MAIDRERALKYLKAFDFARLFTQELGWDKFSVPLTKHVDGRDYRFTGVAEKHGVVVLVCDSIPEYSIRVKLDKLVAKDHFEHLIVFTDQPRGRQVWQWFRKEPGRPVAVRTYHFGPGQSGELLLQKLEGLVFTLEEEELLTLTSVTGRLRTFDVEKVTKKFYERFKTEHSSFLSFIKGIPDKQMESWYASVMVNRLMFLYFIQEKGLLNGDRDYLRNKLAESRDRKQDGYYRDFLCPLFFQGFARKKSERSATVNRLLGEIPYLNGGLFQPHQIEELHGRQIQIADSAFKKLFTFFKEYDWHLDERENRTGNEINPDVLGYIFEKYINQKQMGAYYTREDITEYIAQNTIIPFLLDESRKGCAVTFAPDGSVWRLLQDDPDRYIHDAMKKGADLPLPADILAGVSDVKQRGGWNRRAPEEFALPTEIWREAIDRHQRYRTLRDKLAAGEVHQVNDLVTLNLNIRQFAQDVIQFCEGPELLRAVWKAIEKISVLDPTCGSGAFLFAALNILKPLYEACLARMQGFIEDNDTVRSKTPEETISELIKLGESLSLEFKSTARWNVKENRKEKAMEQVIVKTVAAFLNSQGGDLLIGIQDDGRILGIEEDQQIWEQSLRNRDTYENWLTGLLLGACGKQHAANLHISFARLDDKEVCRVTVLPSPSAVYVKVENVETLYVRAGNSTHPLPVKEAVAYHQQRFTNFRPRPVGPEKSQTPKKYIDFRNVFEESKRHPKQDYFILKAIIVNNLFGVDIMEEAIEICKLRLFLKLVAQVESQDRIEPLPDIDFNIRAGNTLVGYAKGSEIQPDRGIRTDEENELLTEIEDKALLLDAKVRTFRIQQTQLDGTVTAEDKAELRRMFSELETELNEYLSGKYGIKKSGINKWRELYKPFHWFCDFHKIIAGGGFDVIIGNPPYVVFPSEKVPYKFPSGLFQSEPAKNLYALTWERSLALLSSQGRGGLIVQLTIMSSERMKVIQDLLLQRGPITSVSFPRRPESVFDGVEMPVAIILSCASHEPTSFSTSRIRRFYTEERANALTTFEFGQHSNRAHGHRVAKLGSDLELSIFSKVTRPDRRSIAELVQKDSKHLVYYQEACRYWAKACLGLPRFKKNGIASEPPHGRTIGFRTREYAGLAVCILNSSLFYWLYSALSDCEHINDDFVRRFPLPSNAEAAGWWLRGDEITRAIRASSSKKAITTKQGYLIEYDEINAAKEKSSIDAIDQLLAIGFDLTVQELDFITNYDIKYRMGADADEDEE